MKTIAVAVTAMLAFFSMTNMASAQSTAYEKKSYNYAEWAKGRFSEVVTVRNPGKIIYVAGVGAEDENSAQGASYGTSAISARSAAMPGTRSNGCWKSTVRRSRMSTRSSPT